jgi:sugar/nucleoside kinase (ribokinase family)
MQVYCAGILVADIIAKTINRYPVKGKLELVDDMKLCSGGCALNTGIGLAKLGIETGVIGKVGKDFFGNFLINTCKKYAIDVQGITKDESLGTSTTMVMVHPGGERSFIHYLGANTNLNIDDLDIELIKKCQILHIAGFFLIPKLEGYLLANLLKRSKEMGVTTSLDTAWNERSKWMKALKPALPYLDVLFSSIDESKMITGKNDLNEIGKSMIDEGVRIITLKMGKEGCYIKTRQEGFRIPAYSVNTVDTTGAGDAFVAGFLTGILKKGPLEKTGRLANAVGALSTTAIGATGGLVSLEKTLEFMNQ